MSSHRRTAQEKVEKINRTDQSNLFPIFQPTPPGEIIEVEIKLLTGLKGPLAALEEGTTVDSLSLISEQDELVLITPRAQVIFGDNYIHLAHKAGRRTVKAVVLPANDASGQLLKLKRVLEKIPSVLEQCMYMSRGKQAWVNLHPETAQGKWDRDAGTRNCCAYPTYTAIIAEAAPFSQRMAQYYLAVVAKLFEIVIKYLLSKRADLANSYSELEKLSNIEDEEQQLKVARKAVEEGKKVKDVILELNLHLTSQTGAGKFAKKLSRFLDLAVELNSYDFFNDPESIPILKKKKFVAQAQEIYCTTKAVADYYTPLAELAADLSATVDLNAPSNQGANKSAKQNDADLHHDAPNADPDDLS